MRSLVEVLNSLSSQKLDLAGCSVDCREPALEAAAVFPDYPQALAVRKIFRPRLPQKQAEPLPHQ